MTRRNFDLEQEIDTTPKQLQEEGFCFHTQCRSHFQKIYSNQQRAPVYNAERSEMIKSCSVQAPKVSRRETISFNNFFCLFCQMDIPGEPLFSVCQTSQNQVLKEAFQECPTSLALYSIRSSPAYDARAGDIKYHNSCWRKIIDRRTPEIQSHPVCHARKVSNCVMAEVSY